MTPSAHRARPFRLGLLLAVAATALGACRPHGRDRAVGTTTRLDCPEAQGALRRTDAAADGRSCRYAGPDGQEVTLAYLALDGRSPQDKLKAVEAQLRADVPSAAAPEPGSLRDADEDAPAGARRGGRDKDDGDDDEDGGRPPPAPPASPGVPAPPKPPEPPQIDRAWSAGAHGDRVHISLPFLHVDADGSGRAHVRTFGVEVNAEGDRAGRALVRTPGGGVVDTHDGGAEMRFGAVGSRRADLVYIVASEHAGPQGFRSGAYVARGPAGGPLVLAVTRSRHDGGSNDGGLRDVKRLVNANVRGFHGFDIDAD